MYSKIVKKEKGLFSMYVILQKHFMPPTLQRLYSALQVTRLSSQMVEAHSPSPDTGPLPSIWA